jgi:hypothetical protein
MTAKRLVFVMIASMLVAPTRPFVQHALPSTGAPIIVKHRGDAGGVAAVG